MPALSIAALVKQRMDKSGGLIGRRLEMGSDQRPEADPAELGQFSLQNCIFVPGTKHLLDNIIKDMLAGLDGFPTFKQQVQCCVESRLATFPQIAFDMVGWLCTVLYCSVL